MTEHCICYVDGYEFKLAESGCMQTEIYPPNDINTPFYSISKTGRIVGKKGYAWDGITGPMFNTKSFHRSSLFHDIVCQAINEGRLDPSWRPQGDKEFRRIAIMDGEGLGVVARQIHRVRAWYAYRAVCAYTKLRNGSKQPEIVHNAP